MPYLKEILVDKNCILRAKAMKCVCSVGMAVGKVKFRDAAKQVITHIHFHLCERWSKMSELSRYLLDTTGS